MKKIIQNNIKLIIGIVIGILCSGVTVYAAYNYLASEVSYSPADQNWKVNSVEEALNELHKEYKNSELGYGVRRRLDAISSAWERIGASEGLQANAQIGTIPIRNDFDSVYPWSDIISYNYDTGTKEIIACYGDSNFTFTPEGNVEVLTKIPEFYYRRYQEDGYEYIYISKEQKDGYTKSEEFSIGRYTMSGNSTRVHSRSGVAPLVNTTITNFRNYARNLGTEFGQLDYHYFILQLLYLVEYADYNSQERLGLGNTNNSGIIQSGSCDILGMHSGSFNGTDKSSIIYRGIEDIFGNLHQMIDGINIKDYQVYICYDKSQYAIDKFDGCYQKLGYVNSNKDGWILNLGYDASHPLVAFPIAINANSNIYVGDHYYQSSGNRIPLVGGGYANGFQVAGLWSFALSNAPSFAYTSVGSRLIKTN